MSTLAGQVVLITGASSGIGAAAAELLAEAGAAVALAARRVGETEELARRIASKGGTAAAFELDVTSEASIEVCVARVVERFGRLDHAFNNAGVGATHKPIEDTSEAEYDLVHDVCLKGAFFCMKHEIRAMRRAAGGGGGSIVNTASVGGLVGVPGSADYVAAKHGLIGLSKSAAMETAQYGIRVNVIAPGATMTDMYRRWLPTPEDQQRVADTGLIKRIASPREIAGYALFAMRDATFTTGSVFVCDGGISV